MQDPWEPGDWLMFMVLFCAAIALLWLFFSWLGAPV